MITLDFIASLPHGEAKAAALTVFNMMQVKPEPEWIKITDDPATLPELSRLVVIRNAGGECFGLRPDYRRTGSDWPWYYSTLAAWSKYDKSLCCDHIRPVGPVPPTHWRPVE